MLIVPGAAVFAGELEQLRLAAGVTRQELARRSGYSTTYMHDLLRGQRGSRPTLEAMMRLSAALDQEPDTFTAYRQVRVCADHPEAIDRLYQFHYQRPAA